ncbi:PIN domain-containing protein [Neisseria yangbaofengii]|uniref:PIN domain-containing protein n=1 Tax=Neisseria yangbaofengii TaxID=2709396 RepID=UPI0013EB0644|nr:PIN domain-containing protein [Neisseria yangbaofengii]
MKHILIDFENVQPKAEQLNGLDDESCHIWLFLGKLQQKSLSVELCEALCRFGKNVHFVRIAKTGKNVLDFYLAYYLGKITEQDNEALICILSRDGGFDVLVEHLEDVGHCKGIVRLAALDDARKNEAELLERAEGERPSENADNKIIQEEPIVEAYKNAAFIGECTRKVFFELMKPDAFKPSMIGNLRKRLLNVLASDLQPFNDKEKMAAVVLVLQKLKDKQFITQNADTNFVEYHLNSDDILERLTQKLVQSKVKSVEGAKNVLTGQAKILFFDIDQNTISDILKYCEREGMLRIENQKIEYPPFPLVVPIPSQSIVVSKEEDVKIMQKVAEFFNKSAKNKPASLKALTNSFKSTLKLSDKQIEKLIRVLVDKKKFAVGETGKITYKK